MSVNNDRVSATRFAGILVLALQIGCTRESDKAGANAAETDPTEHTEESESADVSEKGPSTSDSSNSTGENGQPTNDAENSTEELTTAPETTDSPSSTEAESGSGNQSTGDSESDAPACEKGAVRTCLETEDGEPIPFPGGTPQGSCKAGEQRCESGAWGRCLGAVGPAPKDTCEPNNDDNCNGRPTDHCTCESGSTQPCGTDVGACEKGTITCQPDGTWSDECVGQVQPSEEICDGKADENCDGKPDEVNCECINGTTKPCGVSDIGACRLGVQRCEKGSWGSCQGAVGPTPERCDGKGIDEDCNGKADVADPRCGCIDNTVDACTVLGKRGDCAAGKKQCRLGKWSQCRSRVSPTEEICGVRTVSDSAQLGPLTGDEDCDGKIDESDASNNFMPKDPFRKGKLYMIDKDGDGYGAIGAVGTVIRRYCNSNTQAVPANYVVDTRGLANSDCGDCPGTGYDVNPGYSGDFRDVPNACLREVNWKHGAFDYNCNGVERKHNRTGVCLVETLGESCQIQAGGVWERSGSGVPECGETDIWINPEDCIPNDSGETITCQKKLAIVRKTQSCR